MKEKQSLTDHEVTFFFIGLCGHSVTLKSSYSEIIMVVLCRLMHSIIHFDMCCGCQPCSKSNRLFWLENSYTIPLRNYDHKVSIYCTICNKIKQSFGWNVNP